MVLRSAFVTELIDIILFKMPVLRTVNMALFSACLTRDARKSVNHCRVLQTTRRVLFMVYSLTDGYTNGSVIIIRMLR